MKRGIYVSESLEIDKDYILDLPEFDVVLALSILHLIYIYQGYTEKQWIELFKAIASKAKKMLVIEVSGGLLSHMKFKDWAFFLESVKIWGEFDDVKIVGISDNHRPIIVCRRG